jgi:hypothetical protein
MSGQNGKEIQTQRAGVKKLFAQRVKIKEGKLRVRIGKRVLRERAQEQAGMRAGDFKKWSRTNIKIVRCTGRGIDWQAHALYRKS